VLRHADTCTPLLLACCPAPHPCSMGIMPTLVMERAVYLRERSDGLYLPLVYLVGGAGEGAVACQGRVQSSSC
jgi:hypothetical protein